jgi:predicted nucleic acid-binding Zn ribbon protein
VRFSSIGQVLAKIQQQPGWEQYQQYCQLLECWEKTVTENTARFARPLYLKREVLWVATSNSARAQELTFQRYSLLKKLNSELPFSLKDIRFSTSGWKSRIEPIQSKDAVAMVRARPYHSRVGFVSPVPNHHQDATNFNDSTDFERSPEVNFEAIDSQSLIARVHRDPQAIVRRWIELAKTKNNQLQSCPECGVSTPEAELKRWNLCHHCIAKKWSTKYRPPTQ